MRAPRSLPRQVYRILMIWLVYHVNRKSKLSFLCSFMCFHSCVMYMVTQFSSFRVSAGNLRHVHDVLIVIIEFCHSPLIVFIVLSLRVCVCVYDEISTFVICLLIFGGSMEGPRGIPAGSHGGVEMRKGNRQQCSSTNGKVAI